MSLVHEHIVLIELHHPCDTSCFTDCSDLISILLNLVAQIKYLNKNDFYNKLLKNNHDIDLIFEYVVTVLSQVVPPRGKGHLVSIVKI